MTEGLQRLIDRQAIVDTTLRYGLAVDTRDWDLFESLFTNQIEVDVSFLGPGGYRPFVAHDWAVSVRENVSGYQSTQHIITNHLVSIDGDSATCRAYLQARHYLPNDAGDPFRDIGGWYDWDLVRTGEGWLVRRYKLTLAWSAGNAALRDIARARLRDQQAA
jgi:hypothetical protein